MRFSKTRKERQKEQERKENQQQKSIAELNRESGEKLIFALKGAEENIQKGFRSQEVVEKFLEHTKKAQLSIQNAESIGRFSTEEMDRVFKGLIDTYSKAVAEGDFETARLGIYYIREGLICYRKDLSEIEAETKNEIINKRVGRLEKYKTALGISNAVFINHKNEEKKKEELEKIGVEFDQVLAETKEMMKLRKDLKDEIDNNPAGIALSPEAGILKAKMSHVNGLKMRMEDIQRKITAFHTQSIEQQQALQILQSQLSTEIANLSQEDQLNLRRAQEEQLEALKRGIDETRNLTAIRVEGHEKLVEFYTSTEEAMHTVETSREFKRILEEEERRRKAEEEGQKRILEEEREETLTL